MMKGRFFGIFSNIIIGSLCFMIVQAKVEQVPLKLDGILAIVADRIVTESDFHQALRSEKKKYAAMQMTVPEKIKAEVLAQLLDTALQLQAADQAGIRVTDQAVNQTIALIAKKNQMTVAQLKLDLQAHGIAYAQYRKKISEQMIIERIQKKIIEPKIKITPDTIDPVYQAALKQRMLSDRYHVKSVWLPFSESETMVGKKRIKRHADWIYAQLKSGKSLDALHVNRDYFLDDFVENDLNWRSLNALPKVFTTPVTRLKKGAYASPIVTANGVHILQLVDKQSTLTPHIVELVHVRHILLRVIQPDQSTLVKARMDRFYQDLKQSKYTFEQLAQKFSEDPDSANQAGDLGWVRPESLSPNFAKAVQHLKVHVLSRPVRSKFGWHLIKVLGKKQQDNTLAELKSQITETMYREAFESEVSHWLADLHQQTYIVLNQHVH